MNDILPGEEGGSLVQVVQVNKSGAKAHSLLVEVNKWDLQTTVDFIVF